MAAVHGPIYPVQHPRTSSFSKPKSRTATPSSSLSSAKADPFYGHEELACLCARYVTHLFHCPAMPPSCSNPQARLPYFIAYSLHRTKLHPSVTHAALVLLSRLKARFPAARGSSGHRLFISAFMISSKVMCDDTYSNKSWSIVAQGLFSLREINQMEHEMVNYLDWELVVDSASLSTFESAVKRDFGPNGHEPFSRYPLEMISKRARTASSSPTSRPQSVVTLFDSDTSSTMPPPMAHVPYDPTPMTPPPEPSYSTSTSPASTPSPETPIGDDNMDVVIEGLQDDFCMTSRPSRPPPSVAKEQFARAVPVCW